MRYLITYDIADDRRREDVATVLSGYSPRVQLSVFECDIASPHAAAELQLHLRGLIDIDEHQIRIYTLEGQAVSEAVILGARVIEERQDFWIVR
jgi:CRISPR-associated protein Cas2